MAKKILEEGTIRRFMKIAGLQPLSEGFVDNLEEEAVEESSHRDEDKMEEGYNEEEPGMEPMREEAAEEPAGEDMSPEPEPEAAEDEEVEVDMGDEGMMGEDEKVDLLQKLAQALGVDVEVEADEEPEMGGDEPAVDMEEPEAGEEDVMEEGEHMEGEDKARPDGTQPPDNKKMQPLKSSTTHMAESREEFKNRIVEQVAKRVAARLKSLS
mgnify:CR=1 FL=1